MIHILKLELFYPDAFMQLGFNRHLINELIKKMYLMADSTLNSRVTCTSLVKPKMVRS